MKMGNSQNVLHVNALHKVQCLRSRLCGEFPTGRGLSIELKYFALLVLAAVLKIPCSLPRNSLRNYVGLNNKFLY